MTIFSRRSAPSIATACDDDLVRIYDSVTGVLTLSLHSPQPIQMMVGSPDSFNLSRMR